MRYPLPETRIVRGAIDATLSHQFHDADGDADDPEGTVTVAVTRSDGTAVTVGAVGGTGTDPRTATIALAELEVVDRLTAVWSISGTAVATDTVDVVGGTIGSVAAITAVETSLASEAAADVKRARRAAEDRFVSTQNRSPFERFNVQRFNGTGMSWLDGGHFPDLVEVRWARIYSNATTYTELSAAELAAIVTPDELARFERTDGGCWPSGRNNIEIGYTFGLTSIPTDLREALYGAVRAQITRTNTGIPDKAVGWASADGINFQIATPGQRGAIYGIPDIDDVWNRYRDPRPVVA